eukprot:TRINITY_DN75962_c0_g1_i1.p1 TRINITY_DN75962_c0_g1~~TRINITY_DN75962_c0_g1_i1.p1  ORF type:complete len:434 (+),score=143.87 TRINITY_DN75962_c0_g1_i1:185-1486(+)
MSFRLPWALAWGTVVLRRGIEAARPDAKAARAEVRHALSAEHADAAEHEHVAAAEHVAAVAQTPSPASTTFTLEEFETQMTQDVQAEEGRATEQENFLDGNVTELHDFFTDSEKGGASSIEEQMKNLEADMTESLNSAFAAKVNYEDNNVSPENVSALKEDYSILADVEMFFAEQNDLMQAAETNAQAAKDVRTDLNTELREITNSIRMHYCAAPPEDSVSWNALPRAIMSNDDESFEYKYTSFEEAWLACGELEWCGQVIKTEKSADYDTKMANDTSGAAALWQNTRIGYFLSSRSVSAINTAATSEYALPTFNKNGCADCNGCEAASWFDPSSDFFSIVQKMFQGLCGIVVAKAVDYNCAPLCPSSCMRMIDDSDSWRVCNSCAGATRDCSTCLQETFQGSEGCSGACSQLEIDCRNCAAGDVPMAVASEG